jgi:hypothetical protein
MNTINALQSADNVKETRSEKAPNAAFRPLAAGIMVVLAGFVRLFPNLKPPNVAPIGALALFSGARSPLWQAIAMPLVCMVISDLLLWRMLAWEPFNIYVYGSFAVYILLGRLLRYTRSPWKIAAVSLVASLQFFLISNFGVWYMYNFYPPTLAGLAQCYTAGLLFFGFTVAGDLGFAAVLFGAYDWLPGLIYGSKRLPAEESVR